MKTYKITLTYTTEDDLATRPNKWNWYELFDIGSNEALSVDEIIEMSITPVTHIDEIYGNNADN